MNMQFEVGDRRETAQITLAKNYHLERRAVCAIVQVVNGSFIPAPFKYYLFRTPSLNGQVIVLKDHLPVSFTVGKPSNIRQGMAESQQSRQFVLPTGQNSLHFIAQVTETPEGGAKCEQYQNGLQWSDLRGLWPAATARANRRYMARALDSSGRLCWIRTSSAERRRVRQPISCIATLTRASATDTKPFTPGLTGRYRFDRHGPLRASTFVAAGLERTPCVDGCDKAGAAGLLTCRLITERTEQPRVGTVYVRLFSVQSSSIPRISHV